MSTYISEPGTRLGGRYRLEDRIAAAGGWSAWKAIDEILARPVSVVTFAAGFPRLPQVVTAARAVSRLTDTRLTQIFDVEDTWDRAYIVLEWPVGETLADLVAGGGLEPIAGARIVAETAAALSGAHAAGLAHLCLQPESVRWTPGGGLKITGLGIDAALAGVSADDPELADTRGLGNLLYAALTGQWPGPDHPDLSPAPIADSRPRRPRQVRAGIPAALDEIACRALDLGSRDGPPFTSPAEVAGALAAAIPPDPIPPAIRPRRDEDRFAPQPRREQRAWPDEIDSWRLEPAPGAGRGPARRSPARMGAVVMVAVIVVAALSAAAVHFLRSNGGHHAGGGRPSTSSSSSPPSSTAVALSPVAAFGFDALRTPTEDPGDENTAQAINLIRHVPPGWATQWYTTPVFGGLKPGSGLILDMGSVVKVTSVTITFGNVPGTDVELKVGNSDQRSAANEQQMTTVASMDNVFGQRTLTVSKPVAGRFLVVWFTRLAPMAQARHKYLAQILSIMIRGIS